MLSYRGSTTDASLILCSMPQLRFRLTSSRKPCPRPSRRQGIALLLVTAVGLASSLGCIERHLLVVTSPPQVQVYVDGHEAGWTEEHFPSEREELGQLAIPFDHYGVREIILRAPGYEPQRHTVDPGIPFYEHFPLDFVFDVLWPGTIENEVVYRFSLEPQRPSDVDGTYAEAAEYRRNAGADLALEEAETAAARAAED